MKLLALCIDDHDSNISYFDGNCVKYFSTDRFFHIKHHDFRRNSSEKISLDQLLNLSLGISISDVDTIGVVTDNFNFSTYPVTKVDLGFNKPTYAFDHHLAHVFSLWPVQKLSDNNFVFDGQGNHDKTHSLFSGGVLISSFDRYTHGSIAEKMRCVGRSLGFSNSALKLNELDLAGKVMGYQAYGTLDTNFYNHLNNFSLRDVWQTWTYPYKSKHIKLVDWIRTVHEWTGDKLVDYFGEFSGSKSFTGGLAQSSVFNGKLYKHFDMQFSPTVSDSGLSIGALELLRLMENIDPLPKDGFPFWQCTDESPELTDKNQIKKIAEQLAKGKIVGVYQGQGEVGPRALGNRSILMDPSIKDGKDIINNKVKHRESFRPFGTACLLEDAELYFDAPKEIPYMNVNVDVKTDEFPSITHVDNSTRLQTVKEGVFYEILTEFKKLTGYGVLLNTSLNIAGKPIASKTEHAKQIFNSTELDAIFCGNEAQLK